MYYSVDNLLPIAYDIIDGLFEKLVDHDLQ
jgi:hypothetical protein